jgi:release factor glutamine methyltransferase
VRPSEVVTRATRYLEAHGVEGARETAEALLMHLLDVDRVELYTRAEGLDSATARSYGRALCQRCAGTPLQHLTGRQAFRGLNLEVRPGVFVPRPETEVLVEAATQVTAGVPRPLVLDVGTGTGAVGLALKRAHRDVRLHAVDVNPEAVELAQRNADRHRLVIDLYLGDLFAPIPSALRGRFDLIVSNPPYVTEAEYEELPEEVRADPYEALVGGTDVHARLADEAPSWLRPGGWLVVEIGTSQADDVSRLFRRTLEEVHALEDLAGRPRVVLGRAPGGG